MYHVEPAVKPDAMRLCRISDPILPRWRLAPMTTTDRGASAGDNDPITADESNYLASGRALASGARMTEHLDGAWEFARGAEIVP